MTPRLPFHRYRRVALIGLLATAILLAGGGLLVSGGSSPRPPLEVRPQTESRPAHQHAATPSTAPRAGSDLDLALARIASLEPHSAATSSAYPPVADAAKLQPDLYAAALVQRLLTQDYRRPRDECLRWIQSEAATTSEPLVVGLVPPALRSRLAVASVQDDVNGEAPIPSAGSWESLAKRGASSSASIVKVSEPYEWSMAVANGEITDPGITARQVDANVTLNQGAGETSTYSVSVLLNLEGPPTRAAYGFVTLVNYTSARVG